MWYLELFIIKPGEQRSLDAGLIPGPTATFLRPWGWAGAGSQLDGKQTRNIAAAQQSGPEAL